MKRNCFLTLFFLLAYTSVFAQLEYYRIYFSVSRQELPVFKADSMCKVVCTQTVSWSENKIYTDTLGSGGSNGWLKFNKSTSVYECGNQGLFFNKTILRMQIISGSDTMTIRMHSDLFIAWFKLDLGDIPFRKGYFELGDADWHACPPDQKYTYCLNSNHQWKNIPLQDRKPDYK